MLWTIFVILLVLWLLGLMSGYTLGGVLHILREAMTKVQEVYKCEACGNVVEVRKAGEGELVCCGEPMKKQ